MLKSAANHAAHVLMEGLIGVTGLAAMAGCVLTWRLAQGPIDITALAQRAQTSLTGAGAHLSIGHAALAWEGFHDPTSPVDIRVTDIGVTTADGTTVLRLPAGRVGLSLPQLLRGQIVPRRIEIDVPTINLRRTADGKLTLDLSNQASDSAASSAGGNRIMAELARPARGSNDQQRALPWLSQLRRVLIRHAHITLDDAALGVVWQVPDGSVNLVRQHDGGVVGDATLALAAGAVRATLIAHADLTASGTRITASSTGISPAALASLSPAFAKFTALDAPLRAMVVANLAPDLTPRDLHLTASLGAGTLHAGTGTLAIESATATLDASPAGANLRDLHVALAPPPGKAGPGPWLTLTGTALRGPGGISASFTADIGTLGFADLATYWPAGTGGGARPWITQNITAGTANGGHIGGTIAAKPDLSGVTLKTLTGALTASDMTLWWLRPIPPLQHADARLIIDSPDVLRIMVGKAQQNSLRLTGGQMRISGLMAKDQIAQIEAGLDGTLPDALLLLAHPRLNLLSRLPFQVDKPAGDVTARLAIRLPLDDRVTMDDISISAEAALANVHLGQIAAGRDLDDGQLTMNVDTDGLTVAGDATLGGIPSSLSLDMDFRAGTPTQIVQHATVRGIATQAALERAGLPGAVMTAGSAAIDLDYTAYRNDTATIAVKADMTGAALTAPLGWAKPAGTPASAEGELALAKGHITSITHVRAKGPGLEITSSVSAQSGKMHILHLDRILVGRTDLRGAITLPETIADPWQISLSGPVLDLSSTLQARSKGTDDTEEDESRGPPWVAELNFGSVILAKDETVTAVSLSAASDGLHVSRARVSADGKRIAASITPVPGGRHLLIDAGNAGAVLLAANLFDNIRGGHLTIDATYDDTAPHAPLTGTATLTTFRLLEAPAIGRLLKAMTLYGGLDLLRGPGMGFAKAVAVFGWQQRVLHLDNARAFSASLGITVQGDIDLRHHLADLKGTIVPAYFFNQLLGNIPVLGKLFSPEKGGGVFAARYSVKGKLADPTIGVNPLSALTPGVLRNVFGLL